MSCEFCSGEMEYMTRYIRLKRRNKKEFPTFTVEAEVTDLSDHNHKVTTAFDFNYCPNCGADMREQRPAQDEYVCGINGAPCNERRPCCDLKKNVEVVE